MRVHIAHNRIGIVITAAVQPRLKTKIKVGLQRSPERLNGVLLDALGEDIPVGGSNIPEGSLAVPLCLTIPGPGNIKDRSRC